MCFTFLDQTQNCNFSRGLKKREIESGKIPIFNLLCKKNFCSVHKMIAYTQHKHDSFSSKNCFLLVSRKKITKLWSQSCESTSSQLIFSLKTRERLDLLPFTNFRIFLISTKKTRFSQKKTLLGNDNHLMCIIQQIFHLHRFWKNSSSFKNLIKFFKKRITFVRIWEISFQFLSLANPSKNCWLKFFTVRRSDTFTDIGHYELAKTSRKRSISAFWVDGVPSILNLWEENNEIVKYTPLFRKLLQIFVLK